MYRKEKDPSNRAQQACVVAIGYARNWRFADAERWLDVARGLDPGCALLERAMADVTTRRPVTPGPVTEAG